MSWLRWLVDRYPHHSEPDGDVLLPHHFYLGTLAALYGFLFVWPTYPQVGATLALIGLLVALDDVVQHAFGIWTPIDWAWKVVMRRFAPDWLRR